MKQQGIAQPARLGLERALLHSPVYLPDEVRVCMVVMMTAGDGDGDRDGERVDRQVINQENSRHTAYITSHIHLSTFAQQVGTRPSKNISLARVTSFRSFPF
jgi:hypothetical protein